jgi:hypothetical protein
MATAAPVSPEPGPARDERAQDRRQRTDAPQQPAQQARAARVPPPYRAACVVIALSLVLGAAFAASYIIALGRPLPRDIPVGVVATPAASSPVVDALQAAAGGALDRHTYPSLRAAETAVDEQQIYAIVDERPMPRRA